MAERGKINQVSHCQCLKFTSGTLRKGRRVVLKLANWAELEDKITDQTVGAERFRDEA